MTHKYSMVWINYLMNTRPQKSKISNSKAFQNLLKIESNGKSFQNKCIYVKKKSNQCLRSILIRQDINGIINK